MQSPEGFNPVKVKLIHYFFIVSLLGAVDFFCFRWVGLGIRNQIKSDEHRFKMAELTSIGTHLGQSTF